MKLRTICEVDASIDKSLNDTPVAPEASNNTIDLDASESDMDIEKEVSKELDKDTAEEVTDTIQVQQQAEDDIRDQQKQVVTPVINQLDQNFGEISQDLLQSQSQSAKAGQSMSGLDQQLGQVRALIKNLEQSMV